MKKIFYLLFVAFGVALTTTSTLHAYNRSPTCYREMQTNFFRSDLVATALSIYSVRQNFWVPIYQDLLTNSQYIPAILQAKARVSNPNPLDPVFLTGPAVQLLQQTLYEVFRNVMLYYSTVSNNIIDMNTINGSFNYIWQQQSPILIGCIQSSGIR